MHASPCFFLGVQMDGLAGQKASRAQSRLELQGAPAAPAATQISQRRPSRARIRTVRCTPRRASLVACTCFQRRSRGLCTVRNPLPVAPRSRRGPLRASTAPACRCSRTGRPRPATGRTLRRSHTTRRFPGCPHRRCCRSRLRPWPLRLSGQGRRKRGHRAALRCTPLHCSRCTAASPRPSRDRGSSRVGPGRRTPRDRRDTARRRSNDRFR